MARRPFSARCPRWLLRRTPPRPPPRANTPVRIEVARSDAMCIRLALRYVGTGTVFRLFEVNRGRVAVRLPDVIAVVWRPGIAGQSGCRRSGHGAAGSLGYGTNRPCGLLVSRA